MQEVNGLQAALFLVRPVLVGQGWRVEDLEAAREAIAGLREDGADKVVWVVWLREKGVAGV